MHSCSGNPNTDSCIRFANKANHMRSIQVRYFTRSLMCLLAANNNRLGIIVSIL